jgi:chromosome segregation ATPase
MNKRKTLSLVLSLLMLVPGTAYAKESKTAPGKPANAQQVVELKKEKVQEQKKVVEDQRKLKQANSEVKSADTEVGKSKGQEHKQEAQQNKDEKKTQIDIFKASMKEKQIEMKAKRQETITLRKDVEQKTEQLSAILGDLQAGKKTLSEKDLNDLLAASGNLKADELAIKETAELSTEARETQARVKDIDFNNALASMDKVIAKYQKRLDALKQLDADLDAALQIANKATVPSPVETTTPAPVQDETQPASEETVPADTTTVTTPTETSGTQDNEQTAPTQESTTTSDTSASEEATGN